MCVHTVLGGRDLSNDYSMLQRILDTEWRYPSEPIGDRYWDSEPQPSHTLPSILCDRVQHFLEAVNETEYPGLSSGLEEKYAAIMVTDFSLPEAEVTDEEDRLINHLISLHDMIGECLSYQDEVSECTIQQITALVNEQEYGTVFVFHRGTYCFMQGITRSTELSFASYFYPELTPVLKVNALLIPAVESYCRDNGIERIYVVPIGKQGDILSRHYGFVPTHPVPYPCDVILGSDTYQDRTFYYKDIIIESNGTVRGTST